MEGIIGVLYIWEEYGCRVICNGMYIIQASIQAWDSKSFAVCYFMEEIRHGIVVHGLLQD